MADFHYRKFNLCSFSQISRSKGNVYNLILCSKTYFEGQQLDRYIIPNIGAVRISEDGGGKVPCIHKSLQIIFSESLDLISIGIPTKKVFFLIFYS